MVLFFSSPAHARYSWAQSYGAESRYPDGTLTPPDEAFYGSGVDYPTGIAKMPDGGVVVAGRLDLPELGSSNINYSAAAGAIVRYGQDGTIRWQMLLKQSNGDISHVNAIKTDAQGNIYICGNKGIGAGGIPSVAKLSPSGTILWQNGINGAAWTQPDPNPAIVTGLHEFASMGITADGGVVVVSDVYEPGNTHSVPAVVKFNGDGTFGFLSVLEVSVQYLNAVSVCQSFDGKSYVVIIPYNGVTILKLGLAGNIISQVNYPPDVATEFPVEIIATPDNGYATISAVSAAFSVYNGGVLIRKINSKLNDVFETAIVRINSNGQGSFTPHSLSLTNDGGYLVGGFEGIAALMRINSSGVLASVSSLGGPSEDAAKGCHAVQLDDGGYAFAASTRSYTGQDYNKPDWWVVKTDAKRHVAGFTGTQIEHSIDPNVGDGGYPPFVQSSSLRPGAASTAFSRISPNAVIAIDTNNPGLGSTLKWVMNNLATKAPPNAPLILIQARQLPPEIVVEQPTGTNLVDGVALIDFKSVAVGATGLEKTFTIRNTGKGDLTGLAVTKNGSQAKDFILTGPVKTSLAGMAHITSTPTTTTFKVKFKPTVLSPAGMFSTATIHIHSNDPNESPFDIKLKAKGVAP